MQALRSLSFARPALGSCRVPAPALEPGTRQHAAAPACDSAFAGQSRKRQAVCCSGTTGTCKKGKETSRNTRCTAGLSVACGHYDLSLQWQALDDCVMLLEVLRCAPYVAGCPELENTWRAYRHHHLQFVLLVFNSRLQAVLLATDICKMICGCEAH